MPSFKEQFIAARGQPIEYKSETLYLADRIPVGNKFKVAVHLVSYKSQYPQIVCLKVTKDGYLICNNKKGATQRLYANGIPPEVEVTGCAKDRLLWVYNAWVRKDWMGHDIVDYWHHGAAMKKKIRGNIIRYYCNDGAPDDDFDDLIFEVAVQ